MKIKVSEATGVQLDWLVAKALITGNNDDLAFGWDAEAGKVAWIPYSSQWGNGGPIIERELHGVEDTTMRGSEGKFNWRAWCYLEEDVCVEEFGPTMLVAGLRCYVASKLGEEVEVPDELA